MDTQDPLSQKYAISMLFFLLDRGNVKQFELLKIISSNMTIEKLSKILEEAGLINIKREFTGRKSYSFSLTPKGRLVAEQLKKAEEIAQKPSAEIEESVEKIELLLANEEAERIREWSFLLHINIMDDHITEEISGKSPRFFNIYIKRNGNGEFLLWCEQDNSYDCWHVKAAWTYPEVQKMMMHYKGKVKICHICGYENAEEGKFCTNCGTKLE
ncbi:hypothetical protein [Thermoplasma acidophilum]|uniref:Zinc-ribbon domain-containing protein n=1 Tax=Thermoplasma acidophilum (strain ATCC 25905 / DSM 1728 / JCM 9062 / NBRC 15155 / AMRC-C165) TaxID=273075 RepID=Q9HID9_THEAC|nr:hypothetical protein [Thermoplasma acidophilum]CAC12521.1 hypothetical protein [Thermoplasma acidophilum]